MIHVLAAFVHGVLALGHFIGVIYNIILGNKKRAALHAIGCGLSTYATYQHVKDVERDACH